MINIDLYYTSENRFHCEFREILYKIHICYSTCRTFMDSRNIFCSANPNELNTQTN